MLEEIFKMAKGFIIIGVGIVTFGIIGHFAGAAGVLLFAVGLCVGSLMEKAGLND